MPKVGMEPIRRKALIDATIAEIGQAGSLDVTVGQIAKRAGMSSGLAHHYFGGKEQILLAAMRQILTNLQLRVRNSLKHAETPIQRIEAIIEANLDAGNFEPDVVASWLTFYVQAQNSPDAQRLLQAYARRLHSNLVVNLSHMMEKPHAEHTARGLGAMIDGIYIRHALEHSAPNRDQAVAMVRDYLELQLAKGTAQ
jgi:TetR/AcrR family transcriptional repressor of bet genes